MMKRSNFARWNIIYLRLFSALIMGLLIFSGVGSMQQKIQAQGCQHDLTVQNVRIYNSSSSEEWLSSGSIIPESTLKVFFTIANTGSQDTGIFRYTVYDNNEVLQRSLWTLNAGEETERRTNSFGFDGNGRHTIKVEIDTDNDVSECNESNNVDNSFYFFINDTTSTPPYKAQWQSQTSSGFVANPSTTIDFEVRFKNTGTEVWRSTPGEGQVVLATYKTSDKQSAPAYTGYDDCPHGSNCGKSYFHDSSWIDTYKAATIDRSVIYPGETATFRTRLSVPHNAVLDEFIEGFALFVNTNNDWPIVVNEANNDAAAYAQVGIDIQPEATESYSAKWITQNEYIENDVHTIAINRGAVRDGMSVTFENTGATWQANKVALFVYDPTGSPSLCPKTQASNQVYNYADLGDPNNPNDQGSWAAPYEGMVVRLGYDVAQGRTGEFRFKLRANQDDPTVNANFCDLHFVLKYQKDNGDWEEIENRTNGDGRGHATAWWRVKSFNGADPGLSQGLNVSSSSITWGDRIEASYTIKNYGDESITFQTISVSCDSPTANDDCDLEDAQYNVTVHSGQTHEIRASRDHFGIADVYGTYTLKASYELNGRWYDFQPKGSGTQTTRTVEVIQETPSAPDLIVEDFWAMRMDTYELINSGDRIPQGTGVKLFARIKNNGTGHTQNSFNLHFNVNGTTLTNILNAPLAPGEIAEPQSSTLTIQDAHTHRLEVIIDTSHVINESDENNNTYSFTFDVQEQVAENYSAEWVSQNEHLEDGVYTIDIKKGEVKDGMSVTFKNKGSGWQRDKVALFVYEPVPNTNPQPGDMPLCPRSNVNEHVYNYADLGDPDDPNDHGSWADLNQGMVVRLGYDVPEGGTGEFRFKLRANRDDPTVNEETCDIHFVLKYQKSDGTWTEIENTINGDQRQYATAWWRVKDEDCNYKPTYELQAGKASHEGCINENQWQQYKFNARSKGAYTIKLIVYTGTADLYAKINNDFPSPFTFNDPWNLNPHGLDEIRIGADNPNIKNLDNIHIAVYAHSKAKYKLLVYRNYLAEWSSQKPPTNPDLESSDLYHRNFDIVTPGDVVDLWVDFKKVEGDNDDHWGSGGRFIVLTEATDSDYTNNCNSTENHFDLFQFIRKNSENSWVADWPDYWIAHGEQIGNSDIYRFNFKVRIPAIDPGHYRIDLGLGTTSSGNTIWVESQESSNNGCDYFARAWFGFKVVKPESGIQIDDPQQGRIVIAEANLSNPHVQLELLHSFNDKSTGYFNRKPVETFVKEFIEQKWGSGTQPQYVAINGTAHWGKLGVAPNPTTSSGSVLGIEGISYGEQGPRQLDIYRASFLTYQPLEQRTAQIHRAGSDAGFPYDVASGDPKDEGIARHYIMNAIQQSKFAVGHQGILIDVSQKNVDPEHEKCDGPESRPVWYVVTCNTLANVDHTRKTAIGISEGGNRVFLAHTDDSVSTLELASMLRNKGAYRAILLDSGSSPQFISYDRQPYGTDRSVINAIIMYDESAPTFSFEVSATGGEAPLGNNVRVNSQSETFSGQAVTLHLEEQAIDEAPTLPNAHANYVYEIHATDTNGAEIQPDQPYEIQVAYNEAALTAGANESTLFLAYWDNTQWQREPTSVVDTVNNTVSATPNHFSTWAILAEEGSDVTEPILTVSAAPTTSVGASYYIPVYLDITPEADLRDIQFYITSSNPAILAPAPDIEPIFAEGFLPEDSLIDIQTSDDGWYFILTSPSTPIVDSGAIVVLPFLTLAEGDVTVTFADHQLTNGSAQAVPHQIKSAQVHVQPEAPDTGSVDGTIYLESRTSGQYANTEVELTNGTNTFTTTTDATGQFAFTDLVLGDYTVRATQSLFVQAQRSLTVVGGSNTMPEVGLWAGDMNEDQQVTAFDWYILSAATYPINHPDFDINDDGRTDGADRIILVRNLNRPDMPITNPPITQARTWTEEERSTEARSTSAAQLELVAQSENEIMLRVVGVDTESYAVGSQLSLPTGATVTDVVAQGPYVGGFLSWQQVDSTLYIVVTPPDGQSVVQDSDVVLIQMSGATEAVTITAGNVVDTTPPTNQSIYLPIIQQ